MQIQPDPLVLAVADRQAPKVAALVDGRVPFPGPRIELVTLVTGENVILKRAFEDPAFHVAELSLARYAAWRAQGDCPYVALPNFPARAFQQGDIYLAPDLDITHPRQLRGLRVGTGDYGHTGHVWARFMLERYYGLAADEVSWIVGHRERIETDAAAFHRPAPPIRWALPSPPRSLSEALERGEIDALISPIPPSSALRPDSGVRRLFSDPAAEAERIFRDSGIFPILHVFGLRRELAEADPGLAPRLSAALSASRRTWVETQRASGAAPTPDLAADDGLDPANTRVLDCFLDWMHGEGLLSRRLSAQQLFAPATTA